MKDKFSRTFFLFWKVPTGGVCAVHKKEMTAGGRIWAHELGQPHVLFLVFKTREAMPINMQTKEADKKMESLLDITVGMCYV